MPITNPHLITGSLASSSGLLTSASQIAIDAAAFDNHLDNTVVNVQLLAQAVDDLNIGTMPGQLTAAQVSVDSTSLTGLLAGSGNVQVALNRLDATGIGAAIFEFTGSYSAQNANINEWFNGRSNVHVQGADGQSNARRTFNLPGLTALGAVFDALAAEGLPETFTMLVSYFGGSSSSTLSNRLTVNPSTNVDNAPGGFGFPNNVILNRADSVTLQISRVGGTIGSWDMISRGLITTTSGQSLNDLEFQDLTWSNRDGTFLPGSDDVLKGYAFRVTGSNPNDGTLRQGLVDGGVTDKVIYDGDWVVWVANTFTSWLNADDWFVLPADDVRRITQQQENFLIETSESDTDNYIRIADDSEAAAGTEALIWLVNPDDALTSAPFLTPTTDPRNNPTTIYIGGRDDRNADGDTVFDLSRFAGNPSIFQGELIVGITGAYINANDTKDIRLEVREIDGTFVTSYNLNDNFVQPPTFGDLTLDYSILSTFKIADSATLLRYHSGQILRLSINRPDREFTLSENVKIRTENIDGGAWEETDLSTPVRAKLNKETSFTAQDRTRLDAIETSTNNVAVPGTTSIQVRVHSASISDDHYRGSTVNQGFLQDYQETITYTIRVANNVEFTGFDFPGGQTRSGSVTLTEIIPSLFENERTYTLVVPAAPDDINYDPFSHIITLTGTLSNVEASGLASSVKVDADNFDQAFLDSIVNHDQSLPATLQALNTQATITHFSNTDFVSNNEHAGIASMFAFLKNRPDERQGDTFPPSATLIKEITNSNISAEISDVVGLFYPRTISSQFDNGVDVTTNGALVGPGAVNETVTITSPNATNFRMVLGFWFDSDPIPDNTIRNLIRVKERGSASFRRLFGIEGTTRINPDTSLVESGILITERVQGSAGTSVTVPVAHHLYTTAGELIHTFSGVGAVETLFRVNEARTYTFSANLVANGNDEGTDTFDYTIANINTSQGPTNHVLTYTVAGHPHTQNVTVEYVANSSTYGGPGHTLRFELTGGLADNVNFDIDHLNVSAGYTTQETISTPATFAEANAGGTPLIKSRKKHRAIFSFRQASSGENLVCQYAITGFDDDGNPTLSQSNTIDFGYSVFDLDWSQVRLGNTNMCVIQNIQGFFLNTDTPLAQFPTSAQMGDWLMSHDEKATDYVWDNASAPSQNVEVVRFPENVNFPNFILEDQENNNRYRLTVKNGAIVTEKVV